MFSELQAGCLCRRKIVAPAFSRTIPHDKNWRRITNKQQLMSTLQMLVAEADI
jgi:hypothetical protein